ncbi:hypothetical protein Tco_1027465 [Tanacetum coccineum]
MLDYGYNFMQTKIHVDNESAICVVKNPVYHSKTKHIEFRHHFIRDSYEKRLIEMVKIHNDNNVANLLTKAFDLLENKLVQNQAPEGEGSATPPEPQPTPSTSQPNVSDLKQEPLPTATPPPVFHEPQTEAHIEQILPSPFTYQRKRKTQKRRRTKKNTKLPQTSVPQDLEADEAIHKEGGMDTGDSPRRQDTIGGAPAQTMSERVLEQPIKPPLSKGHTSGSKEGRMEHQFELTANVPITHHDSPLPRGYTPGSDEGRLKLQELMTICTKLSKQVLDLEKEKDAQAVKILRLKKRVESSDDDLMMRMHLNRGGAGQDRANVMQLLKWKLHENCGVHILFMDGTPMEINMLIEKKYLLIKELLEKMLNLQLEAEEESTMAFELIKFIKSMLEEE